MSSKFKVLDDGLLINKISKTYGNKKVVRDISISINRREVVGLLGPNGAGKTTTFYIIVGLVKPDTGSIILDKLDVSNLPIYLRGKLGISYLPQEASIFRGMSVEDNLLSIIEIKEKDKNKQIIILQNLLNEFDINHVRKSKSVVLSGGERRRLEIARTLATNPKYLLLDEPLTGIDPVSIEEIKTIIKKLKERNIGILIKFPKIKQDLRADLPTIGLDTFYDCKRAKIKGIVLKSKQNIFLDKNKCINFANKNKMFINVQ